MPAASVGIGVTSVNNISASDIRSVTLVDNLVTIVTRRPIVSYDMANFNFVCEYAAELQYIFQINDYTIQVQLDTFIPPGYTAELQLANNAIVFFSPEGSYPVRNNAVSIVDFTVQQDMDQLPDLIVNLTDISSLDKDYDHGIVEWGDGNSSTIAPGDALVYTYAAPAEEYHVVLTRYKDDDTVIDSVQHNLAVVDS